MNEIRSRESKFEFFDDPEFTWNGDKNHYPEKGLSVFSYQNDPDFVIARGVLTIKPLARWIRAYTIKNPGEEIIRFEIMRKKDSQDKKNDKYIKLDTWKPDSSMRKSDDDVPF